MTRYSIVWRLSADCTGRPHPVIDGLDLATVSFALAGSYLRIGSLGCCVGLQDLAHLVAGRDKQKYDQDSDESDKDDADGCAQPAKSKAFIFLFRLFLLINFYFVRSRCHGV